MIKCIDGGRKPTMQTEYTIGNNGRHWKVIKGVSEMFPHVGVSVLSKALVVKAIDLSNLATFVVSPEDRNTVSVSDFQSNEQRHCFQRVISSVDIISHEQIVRFRALPSNTEKLR